jgi:hypothetical protein
LYFLPDPHGQNWFRPILGKISWFLSTVEFTNVHAALIPGIAKLTGVAWAWQPADPAIFVTRIEHVRNFLASIP